MPVTDEISVVSVFVALISLATQVAEKFGTLLLKVYRNWVTGGLELEEYPHWVEALERSVVEWHRDFRKFGLSDSLGLASRLETAERLLEDVRERRNKFQVSRLSKFKRRFAAIAFPSELSYVINRVKEAFGDIRQHLEDIAVIGPIINTALEWEPSRLSFYRDDLYTSIAEAEARVKGHLEGEEHEVVVLYGEPGSGKTCLVKHLALDYQGRIMEWRAAGELGDPPLFQDGVFFVQCGLGAERTKIIEKLLQDMGVLGPPAAPVIQEGVGMAMEPDVAQMEKLLRSSLYLQSVLIVVDDVCDPSILNALLVPKKSGIYRKFLVTTQNASWIPSSGREKRLRMSDLEDAAQFNRTRKEMMMRRMVQIGDDVSTLDNLEDQMNGSSVIRESQQKLIEETNGNPQALACLCELLRDRVLYEDRWQQLVDPEEEFFTTLENETLANRLGHAQTILSSMMYAVNLVVQKEPRLLDLLLFLAICDNPVPEAALRAITYALDKRRGTTRRFPLVHWLDVLENLSIVDRAILQAPTDGRLEPEEGTSHKQKMYSMRRLRALIVRREMANEVRRMVKEIPVSRNTPYDVSTGRELSAVCYDIPTAEKLLSELFSTFGGETLVKLRAEKTGRSMEDPNSNSDEYVRDASESQLRKSFAEEAVRLLNSELEDRLSQRRMSDEEALMKKGHDLGKKMLVQVISQGGVHDEDIAQLLEVSEACALIVCRALKILLTVQPLAMGELSTGLEVIEDVNLLAMWRMRGLRPTTLFRYIESMISEKKTPSLFVQLHAVEVASAYVKTISSQRGGEEEVARFAHFDRDTERSTVGVIAQLLRHVKTRREELQIVKGYLDSREKLKVEVFAAYLKDGLLDLRILKVDSAVEMMVKEVEPKVKLRPSDGVYLPDSETIKMVERTIDQALERCDRIEKVTVNTVETLLAPIEDDVKHEYRQLLSLPTSTSAS